MISLFSDIYLPDNNSNLRENKTKQIDWFFVFIGVSLWANCLFIILGRSIYSLIKKIFFFSELLDKIGV
jgi:hypothetical protein